MPSKPVATPGKHTAYCGCLRCKCRRTVAERPDICRQCRANLHDGRPNLQHP